MKTKLFAWVSWIPFLVSAAAEWGFDFDLPLTPALWLVVAAVVFFATNAPAALTTNRWQANDGKWEIGANWDQGVPTLSDSINLISNNGTLGHTITIDGATVVSSLTISNLTLTGTVMFPHTLLLTNAPLASPLTIINTLSIGNQTSVVISNAALQVGIASAGTFFDDGALTMFGGTFTATNAGTIFAIGNAGGGRLTVTGGTWRALDVFAGRLAGSQGTLTMAGGTNLLSGSLSAGRFAGSTGAVWMTGGQLTVTNDATLVGYVGVGQMTVSGGVWRAQEVRVGSTTGSQGTLTIAGGTNVFSDALSVGAEIGATGAVWMTGGQLTVTNAATIVGDDGVGQMTVSNGTWRAMDVRVGQTNDSQGTLTIAGGTNVVSRHLNAGLLQGATGAVWMTGGQLIVTNNLTSIGGSGVGQMSVSNGTWLGEAVYIGVNTGSQGTLTVAGGTVTLSGLLRTVRNGAIWVTGGQLTTTNLATEIGYTAVGQMTVSNGTWLVNDVNVGMNSGAQGTLTIAGGSNLVVGILDIASVDTFGTGAVWVTGGQLTITNNNTYIGDIGVGQMTVSNGTWRTRTVEIGSSDGSHGTLSVAGGTNSLSRDLVVGVFDGGTGEVWVTGGLLTVTNGETDIGNFGVGQMAVSNGTWRARKVSLCSNAGSQGTLTIAGGTGLISSNLIIGEYGCSVTGSVAVTGGQLRVTNNTATAVLEVRSGTLTQTGGTLDIDRLVVTDPCARFIHTGGTLIYGILNLSTNQFFDADGDGMDNKWEMDNGLDPLDPADATLDNDGDGQSNLEEFTMGTDPNDANSRFRVISIVRTNNDVRITWTVAPKSGNGLFLDYYVQWGTNLLTGVTNNLSPVIAIGPGFSASTTNYLDVGGATNRPARFYRIRGFID